MSCQADQPRAPLFGSRQSSAIICPAHVSHLEVGWVHVWRKANQDLAMQRVHEVAARGGEVVVGGGVGQARDLAQARIRPAVMRCGAFVVLQCVACLARGAA